MFDDVGDLACSKLWSVGVRLPSHIVEHLIDDGTPQLGIVHRAQSCGHDRKLP
jgi:hypothetical protein